MSNEAKSQILSCMEWDRSVIDDIRQNEQISDRARRLLQAIREHSDEYTELLNGSNPVA